MSQQKRGRITIQSQPPKQTRIVQKLAMLPFLLVSGMFVVIGITVVIPGAGLFGIVWTLMAVCFFGIGLFNLIAKNGLPHRVGYQVETDVEEETIVGLLEEAGQSAPSPAVQEHNHIPSTALDVKGRLEQLEALKKAGLLTEQEYQQKRQEIIKQL